VGNLCCDRKRFSRTDHAKPCRSPLRVFRVDVVELCHAACLVWSSSVARESGAHWGYISEPRGCWSSCTDRDHGTCVWSQCRCCASGHTANFLRGKYGPASV